MPREYSTALSLEEFRQKLEELEIPGRLGRGSKAAPAHTRMGLQVRAESPTAWYLMAQPLVRAQGNAAAAECIAYVEYYSAPGVRQGRVRITRHARYNERLRVASVLATAGLGGCGAYQLAIGGTTLPLLMLPFFIVSALIVLSAYHNPVPELARALGLEALANQPI